MNHDYRHRLEEATHYTIRVVVAGCCPIYQLIDPYDNVIEEFEDFEDLQCYTIEAVERFEASQGVE